MLAWDTSFLMEIFNQTMREGIIECLASLLDIKAGFPEGDQRIRHDTALAEVLFSSFFRFEINIRSPKIMLNHLVCFVPEHTNKGFNQKFVAKKIEWHVSIWREEAKNAIAFEQALMIPDR